MRFEGKIGVDMRYSTKSAYGKIKKKKTYKSIKKIKILIAAHCFSDSPHSYGYNILMISMIGLKIWELLVKKLIMIGM